MEKKSECSPSAKLKRQSTLTEFDFDVPSTVMIFPFQRDLDKKRENTASTTAFKHVNKKTETTNKDPEKET